MALAQMVGRYGPRDGDEATADRRDERPPVQDYPYLDRVLAYRVAVRRELGDRTFSPASFGWDAWDGRDRCPICRDELTVGA